MSLSLLFAPPQCFVYFALRIVILTGFNVFDVSLCQDIGLKVGVLCSPGARGFPFPLTAFL